MISNYKLKKSSPLAITNVTTDNKMHYSLGFPHNQYNPPLFYKDGYTVFGIMNHREDDYKSVIYLYNHSTKTLVSQNWGSYPLTGDYHNNPTLRFLGDGRIVAFITSDHNAEIDIKISNNPYDISSFTDVTSISDEFPAYANVTQVGSRYYVFTRGALFKNFIYWSDDNCQTFTSGLQVTQLASSTTAWAYPRGIYSTDKIRVCVNERSGAGGSYDELYYLESDDGINWNNLGNTFSKNVSTSGFITNAEMQANFLVENIGFVGGVSYLDSGEIVYHVNGQIRYTNSGVVEFINLVSDNYQDFNVQNKSQLLKKSDTEWYLLCKATNIETSSYDVVIVYTSDFFQNIKVTKLFEGSNYLTPNVAYNFSDGVEALITSLELKVYGSGDVIDPFNSYSDFSYINGLRL